MRLAFAAFVLGVALFAAPARAEETCMAEIPISQALVAEAAKFEWRGSDARGRAPAFLLGLLHYLRDDEALADGAHGGLLFLRGADGGWRAFLPRAGENVVGAFVAPSTGAVTLLMQLQTEGPGQSWSLVRATEAPSPASCTDIAFPAELNQPAWTSEYLDLRDFDMRANGRGEIIGVARVAREDAERVWAFRYRTRDGGATWGPPSRMARERAARAGLFEALPEGPAPAALVAQLTAFAAAH